MPARSTPTAVALAGSDAARGGEEYLTVSEVAARFKLAPKTVRNRMHDGTWPKGVIWFSPRGLGPRFKWSALVCWLEGGAEGEGRGDGLAYGPDIPRERPRQIRVDGAGSAAV
jgi:hypothetical protein